MNPPSSTPSIEELVEARSRNLLRWHELERELLEKYRGRLSRSHLFRVMTGAPRPPWWRPLARRRYDRIMAVINLVKVTRPSA